mgnify:CR=1 FL=1
MACTHGGAHCSNRFYRVHAVGHFAEHAVAPAFRVFGGVPGRGIYDNMKTAVDRVGRGKQRDINARFKAMASHYVFEPEFCNPAAGWEKGQVEKNVQDARNRMWQVMPVFKDLDELNQWLEDRCIALWIETPHRDLPGTIADIWEAEKPMLMALPPAFDGFVEHSKRVSPTCLITFERNRYSVPASFANRRISLHVYPERLVIVAEGKTVCTHERIIDRSQGVCEILCPDAFSYAMGKRSSNMMASWLLTRCHSRTDRFHSAEVALSAK